MGLVPNSALARDGWRFLLAGGGNTLFTLGVYQVLVTYWSATLAWTVAWGSGLVLVSFAYPKYVFERGRLTARRVCLNIVYYVCAYLISLGLLAFFVNSLGWGPRVASLAVLAVTVPLNFVCSRCIYTLKVEK